MQASEGDAAPADFISWLQPALQMGWPPEILYYDYRNPPLDITNKCSQVSKMGHDSADSRNAFINGSSMSTFATQAAPQVPAFHNSFL